MFVLKKCNVLFKAKPGKPQEPFNSKPLTKDSVELSWKQPDSDGGSPITGYLIEKRDSKSFSARWSHAEQTSDDSTTVVLKRLQTGSEFLFRVSAVNKIGTGEPLEMAKPVTVKSPYGKCFLKMYGKFILLVFENNHGYL